MEYADFKSWPGISSCGVFARHGFPSDLLIPVLVSMATLFSARSPTFTHGEQRLWRDVEGCAFEKLYFFFFFISFSHLCWNKLSWVCVCLCVCACVCVCVYFSYSANSVWGNQHGDTSIYLDNITRILDRLLDGYDNRLRPGFGGMMMTVSGCNSLDIIAS